MNMRKLIKTYNNDKKKKKKKKNVNLSQYFRGVAWDFKGVHTARKLGAIRNLGSMPTPTISAERFYNKMRQKMQ